MDETNIKNNYPGGSCSLRLNPECQESLNKAVISIRVVDQILKWLSALKWRVWSKTQKSKFSNELESLKRIGLLRTA